MTYKPVGVDETGSFPARVMAKLATLFAAKSHESRTDNPHAVTKAQVGLGSVDNTSDAARQAAQDLRTTQQFTDRGVPSVFPIAFKNLIRNPRVKTTSTDWFYYPGVGGAATIARLTGQTTPVGAECFRATWTTASTNGGDVRVQDNANGSASVAPGDVVCDSIWVRPSVTRSMRAQVLFKNSSNIDLAATAGPAINCPAGQWTLLWVVGSSAAPAGTDHMTIVAQCAAAPWPQVGETIDAVGGMAVKGLYLPAYFDGDYPGCMWDGSAHASPTSKKLLTASDLTRGGALPPSLEGLGFPEGQVQAPVGTRYVDLLATCGAIEWIKASGTGNTGWKVVYGDTGARTSLTPRSADGFTGATSALERVGDKVTLTFNNLTRAASASGWINAYDIPAGFRSTKFTTYYKSLQALIRSPVSNQIAILAPGTADYGTIEWYTNDAWPSTLP